MNSTTAAVPLPSGVRHLVDHLIDEVRCGMRRFWRGGPYANAPAGEKTSVLNQLLRILRWTFVMVAVWLPPLAPVRRRKDMARPRRYAPVRATRFKLFARFKLVYADAQKRPVPRAFVGPRDRFLTAQRKLDALARALADSPVRANLGPRLRRRQQCPTSEASPVSGTRIAAAAPATVRGECASDAPLEGSGHRIDLGRQDARSDPRSQETGWRRSLRFRPGCAGSTESPCDADEGARG